jgi:hypothetical protein
VNHFGKHANLHLAAAGHDSMSERTSLVAQGIELSAHDHCSGQVGYLLGGDS